MEKIYILLLSVAGWFSASVGQIVQNGQCEQFSNLANINLDDFLGTWHEIHRSENSVQRGDCSTLTLTNNNNGTVNLNVLAVDQNFEASGTGVVTQTENTARLTVTADGFEQPLDFWILFTDPTSYALGYSCINVDATSRAVYIWTLSRLRSYAAPLIETLIQNTLSNTLGISLTDLLEIDHSDSACYLLPNVEAGEPIVLPGQCGSQDIPVVQNFNRDAFMGRWRLIESYYSEFQTGTCNEAIYTAQGTDSFTVQNNNVVSQSLDSISGTASPSSTDGSATFQVTLPSSSTPIDYWILATDYNSYALAYSCENVNTEQMRVYSWKFSRSGSLSENATIAIDAVIQDVVVLNNRFYYTINRSDTGCFYYPTPDGNPVVFPNQCDGSISGMANFDVARYLGTWYEIESYPQPFIFGTCSTANYALGDDSVIVFNTEVVNQTLSTITGLATIASNDGSGQLLVVFPGLPGTELWVLDTDYDNYAVVYACQNIDAYSRQVISWKLSRTKQLSTASNTAINNAINNIQVLSQQYYQETDHTDDGCFYFPVPVLGEVVIFPGQCDDTIQAVTNFDTSLYSGIWYEVSAYPKQDIEGQCINYEYATTNPTTLSVSTSLVTDQQLIGISGTAAQTSTDGSGRFTITKTFNGVSFEIPYWVVATDYFNYALAYGCRNVDALTRQVWSWKLSRTRELTTASNTAIDTAMSSIQVLEERYFETTQQTEEACFYLPDLELTEPVIFPGQCDANINVMPNFDASRYLGTWNLIQSYYSDFQLGTCNDATYSLGADGSIVVFNTEVVNQTLETITGSAVITENAKLLVTFPNTDTPTELWILDTDYESYALVYSCQSLQNDQQRIWSWKMSRTDALTAQSDAAINQVIDSVNVLNNRYYSTIDRSDAACFYFPTPDGTPVSFRGQCDDSITAIPNFDVARYLGTWYDIESYPQPFIFGTCGTANYALGDDGVIVFNTEVVNQTLSTITGLATIASNDGSGKLLVVFPGLPGTELWVLDTDYDNYALVYACQNTGNNRRQVISWKLGRTKQLSTASSTAINNVVNNIQVLSQQYYQVTDHTDEGCFYFPDPVPGAEVIFPGQCDDTIQAVANFDNARYAGIWHEIADYPKNDIPGECTNYEFTTTTTNNMNIISRQVSDVQLISLDGVVTRTSTDGSGRFTITKTISGSPVDVPYWVLATDYDNYALAYGCRNVNQYFRQIFTWKLSRTKELSTASNNAINEVANSIQVLDDRYYEDTSQTDDSCFFLPDLTLTEPVIFPGQCDASVPVVQNFEAARYLGTWNLVENYYSDFQFGSCNDATYTLAGDGSIDVYNTEVVNETLATITGSAQIATTDGSAKLIVNFPNADPIEYWVLATDYDSYALVYSCVNVNSDQRRVWSWKMSRTDSLTDQNIAAINQAISNVNVLENRYYSIIDRSDAACFYFPTPDGTPVSFRGQCDESVTAISNFDVARYLGTWYDIESYPQPFIFGTCATANYALGEDGVIVFNTEVVNQTLSTITGLATIASDDGSGKLLVVFPGLPATELWVLDTDYDNYAVVYACQNINSNRRQVISWKLSRTKQLLTASNTAINNVINNIQVLNQQYYQVTDHTDDGCFYFPDPVLGEEVIFPGQCDDTISAVANFDNERYAGIWHEIADYPKNEIPGECTNYEFTTTTTNNMNIISRQVSDVQLISLDGVVTRTSTDGSGRFTITKTISGSPVDVPYWVLATDYNNYALAYGCRNVNQYFRQIFTWKLSRTKELSTASNNAINEVVNSIQVLDDRYYEDTSQTDDSCFFLPDLTLTEPVIFPGQCDATIPVVQNFEAARYLGTWNLIENYYSDFQLGTCNDATYTLVGDGSIEVYNTEVVNETLATITGSAQIATTDGSAKLIVNFPNADPIEYWVLATDYDSYALVYSCVNVNSDQRRVWSWKMSRTNSLTDQNIAAINQAMDNVDVLHNRYYSTIDRSDAACFYFPTPDGTPVSFRGQCDQSISGIPNFDVARYLGTWYDIQSYPQPFIFGTCGTANYALGDEGVIVFNTEVVNQTLSTITGLATIASNDGSGQLLVVFPGLPGTELWVLDTDYDNYALVYACQNTGNNRRQVISWKLSRTKQLSAASNTAINNVVNNIQVLNQQYYQVTDHTDEGCFYFPDPVPGEEVIFPGQCDDTIQAVASFDNARYAGIWHEIADYPKNDIPGECTNYEFTTTTTNNMNIVSRQVSDLQLISFDGVVTRTSTDGSGRFTITKTISGSPVDVPYWVIATDYDNYALAYGCRNVNQYFRQIFTWKLSRAKELSTASNNAINEILDTIEVLDERYYADTSQTDDSCFYLPDLTLTEPAIFPGQCDASLPVVQNFEAARYLGTWRLIETYYSDFQIGTCNEATYSLADDGFIVVFNTEVINETLATITGSAQIATTDGSAKLLVNFPDAEPIEYWVVATDYDSYSLVYSCVNINSDQRRVWSWKMSRTYNLLANAVSAIEQAVNSVNVLDDRYFSTISRADTDCFYYPEYAAGQTVIFRGQCDENVQVVQNFDLARYMGLWYDIESYPQEFQSGTCATAQYTLTDAGVQVYNTEVINQRLFEINGTAVPAVEDGSAKFEVTFPIAGTSFTIQSPYWVLGTDYDSYALVYSCTNIDDYYRRVTSWKLSRDQVLSTTAQTTINSITSNVQVLDQRYYRERGHSFDECLAYPENYGGPVVLQGQCNTNITTVGNFDVNAFSGPWYEVSRFPSELETGQCGESSFVVNNDNTFTFTQTMIVNERLVTVSGIATPDSSGTITADLSGDGVNIQMTFNILDTDYTGFALLHSCRNLNSEEIQVYSWKLSRSKAGLSSAANERIDAIVSTELELFEDYYEPTDQTVVGCFHYPEFETLPETIVLLGPCDTTIQGIPNFNVEAFMGRWFEVARYPNVFQTGQCNRAHYSASSASTFTLMNENVLDENLLTVQGSGVASSDGRGVLDVTIERSSGPTTATLYVLATDYNNYALLYTCRNRDDGDREVSSWKLSRDTTLDSSYNGILDNVVRDTQGLLDDYYTPTSQSDESCFYIPQPVESQASLFRGQCEDISGMEGFDINRYVGWWHEIERYPVNGVVGDCISSQYQETGNQYQVVDTSVFGLQADVSTHTITATTNGRLRKTLPNGQVEDLWVLATDYETYSLVYSCENVNSEYRRVWSAKHSKDRQLTEAAQAALTPVIEGNQVLYPQFYFPVNQDDQACFHYPQTTGSQVILPGQCDLNIPVVQNFDAVEYTGTWYQIEKYPQLWESGTCIGARYSLDEETGVVDVLNWEVIDGELVTIEGTASVISEDGSAKLSVILPVVGTNDTVKTDLYVLATDYVSYSLAYSCANVNEFQRAVGAWKLSRTRTMPSEGTSAINAIILQREELHQPFFVQTQHDEECEEPSSALLVKSSIIVTLLCALIHILY